MLLTLFIHQASKKLALHVGKLFVLLLLLGCGSVVEWRRNGAQEPDRGEKQPASELRSSRRETTSEQRAASTRIETKSEEAELQQ